ncbi:MAG: DUF5658 family protein [Archaeoglobaceae archaeon]|nr:DUF5658 family protein [Archaeoglobaceae archaeon]
MQEFIANKPFITIFCILSLLSTLDIITTHYVISNGVGYESNELISNFVGEIYFYFLKFFLTIAIIWLVAILYYSKSKEEVYSGLLALAIFYSIVVLNNSLVIFYNVDLDLNFAKLLLCFILIYFITWKLIRFASRSKKKEMLKYYKDYKAYRHH